MSSKRIQKETGRPLVAMQDILRPHAPLVYDRPQARWCDPRPRGLNQEEQYTHIFLPSRWRAPYLPARTRLAARRFACLHDSHRQPPLYVATP